MDITDGAALRGKRVAILATDGVERHELQEPMEAVSAAGAERRRCR